MANTQVSQPAEPAEIQALPRTTTISPPSISTYLIKLLHSLPLLHQPPASAPLVAGSPSIKTHSFIYLQQLFWRICVAGWITDDSILRSSPADLFSDVFQLSYASPLPACVISVLPLFFTTRQGWSPLGSNLRLLLTAPRFTDVHVNSNLKRHIHIRLLPELSAPSILSRPFIPLNISSFLNDETFSSLILWVDEPNMHHTPNICISWGPGGSGSDTNSVGH
ncbi:hypothetical protein AJ78_07757 [Emergomyces pasteurianus Ep9510]|uniref:Uncharacterized protein n=1 Tax=Emergomyces pasteurianus Ep9510 TaxID=1447872 RepID=A0A1J9P426_9EURO|nr:hypothetical protein AJ78_07757 [Emergomyces pasteurianus Ep9510]